MASMEREQVESALAAAIDADGYMPPGYGYSRPEMASIAYRRWHSFSRRTKAKHPTDDQRTLDLAKGLQEHFDSVHHDCQSDFVHFAKIMSPILKNGDANNS
jgi:hypothetical protein